MDPAAPDLPAPAPKAVRPHVAGRRIRHLVKAVIVLALATAGVRALLPLVVERGAAFASRQFLGLPARVENVDLLLVKGGIVLEGVSVGPEADAASPLSAALNPPAIDLATALLHIDRLAVRISWSGLLARSIHLTEVEIDAPGIRLVRGADGKITPLGASAAPAPATQTQTAPSLSWPVVLDRLTLREPSVRIVDAASGANLLEFALRSFALSEVEMRDGNFELGDVSIHGPELRVKKELLAEAEADEEKLADSPPPPPGAGSEYPSGYRVRKIAIEGAKFTWLGKDGPLDATFSLDASGVTTTPGEVFPIDLKLAVGAAAIHLQGDTGLLPPSFKGRAAWSNLTFPPLLLAARPELAAWLRSADSSGEVNLEADMGGLHGPPGFRVSGRGTLDGFAVSDPEKNEIAVSWERVEVVADDVFIPLPEVSKPPGTITADLALVRLSGPRFRYTHPASALDALLGPPPADGSGGAPAADASAPPLRLAVASLEVDGAEIELHDTTVQPTALSSVRALSLVMKDLRFPDPSASAVSLRATLPAASTLSIEGSLQPGLRGTFAVVLEDLDLPPFSPYATSAAGASLDAGRVSLKTTLETDGAAISSKNDIVLRKIGLSLRDHDSFSREFGMPIALVIALLSDPAGDIRLSVPIRMDEKGATLPLGPVVGSAIKAAILGAVSSPLKLLGAGFATIPGTPGSSLSIAPVKSPPGSPDLDADAPKRAASLAKLLAKRPALAPVFHGRSGPADHPFLAEQILNERIADGDGLPALEGVGPLGAFRMRQILARRAKGASISSKDATLFQRYLDAVEIPQARLDALARSRAEAARKLVAAAGADARRLTLGPPEPPGDPGVVISFGAPAKSEPAGRSRE